MVKRFIPYVLIFFCVLPAILPLYSNSVLGSADNLAHLFRIVNLDYALQQGYVWPRWAALEGHGFGAPIFNFNYLFPYYITAGLWHMAGSLIHGSQLYMMLVLALSAFTMYGFITEFFGMAAAIVSAIVYVYFPYHLMTVYLYGSYGEALAFVFVPLVLTFLYRFLSHHSFNYFLLASFSLGLLILSHNLSAIIAVVLMVTMTPLCWLHNKEKIHTMIHTIGVVFTASLITAWFWLPALFENKYTKLGILFEKESTLRDHFFQVIKPIIENSWKLLQFEAPSYYSYAIGIPSILVFVFATALLIKQGIYVLRVTKKSTFFTLWLVGLYFIGWCVLSFLMTRSITEPLWSLLPARLNFFSYPYRFFFITTLSVAGIAAYVLDIVWNHVDKRIAFTTSIMISGLFIWQGYMYTRPAIDRFLFTEQYFQSPQTVRSAPNTYKNMGYIEFIPATADSDFINGLDMLPEPKSRAEVISGEATASVRIQKAQDLYIDVNASTQSMLQVNIVYFPGWIGIINEKRVTPTIDTVGRMLFTLPTGQYQLHIAFQNTPIRSIATAISIISFCGLLLFWRQQHYA